MANFERLGSGAFTVASAAQRGCEGVGVQDADICKALLTEVFNRQRQSKPTTIFDLHEATGTELARIFAVIRALEHARVVTIRDDSSDAFGALIELSENWDEQSLGQPVAKEL